MNFKLNKNTDLNKLSNDIAEPLLIQIFSTINKIIEENKDNNEPLDINVDVHVNITKIS